MITHITVQEKYHISLLKNVKKYYNFDTIVNVSAFIELKRLTS